MFFYIFWYHEFKVNESKVIESKSLIEKLKNMRDHGHIYLYFVERIFCKIHTSIMDITITKLQMDCKWIANGILTPSSPKTSLSEYELFRYLDYCNPSDISIKQAAADCFIFLSVRLNVSLEIKELIKFSFSLRQCYHNAAQSLFNNIDRKSVV